MSRFDDLAHHFLIICTMALLIGFCMGLYFGSKVLVPPTGFARDSHGNWVECK